MAYSHFPLDDKIKTFATVKWTSSKPSLGAADPLDSGHGHAVQGDEGREAGVGGHVPHGSLLATAFKVDLMYVIWCKLWMVGEYFPDG